MPSTPSHYLLTWVPLMSIQVHPPIQEEAHTLRLQQAALRPGVPDPEIRTARPTLLNDAVAGNSGAHRGVVHGPANDPG